MLLCALEALISFSTNDKINDNKKTLKEFVKTLEYGGNFKYQQREAKLKLMELKQEDDFEMFIKKFSNLINQIKDVGEEDKITMFLKALRPQVKYEIEKAEVDTLQEAIMIARKFEKMKAKTFEKKPTNINFINKNYMKNNNYKSGNTVGKKIFEKKDIICYKCQKSGHIAKNCFANNMNNNKNNKAFGRSEIKKCFKCGKPGHFANKCNMKSVRYVNEKKEYDVNAVEVLVNSVSNENAMRVDGYVNGNKVEFILDSGAAISVINERVLNKYNMSIFKTNQKIKTATNDVRNAIGTTGNVRVEIKGQVVEMQFLIVDHDDHEALLGYDWFMATGAGIIPYENVLKFPSKTININEPIKDIYC